MKKSEMYRKAALAVLRSGSLRDNEKTDIIAELMDAANLAEYCEKKAPAKEEAKAALIADLMAPPVEVVAE